MGDAARARSTSSTAGAAKVAENGVCAATLVNNRKSCGAIAVEASRDRGVTARFSPQESNTLAK